MSLTAQIISTSVAALALCLGIQAPRIRVQDRPAPVQGHSTIRGVATYADTGRPVRYAAVQLMNDETGEWTESGVWTNRHGAFVVQNIPAGRYVVFVNSPGLLKPPELWTSPGSMIARLRLSGATFTDAVVNGTDSVDVRVQAVRGGVITGRVVTEDDQPLADADIKLLKRENGKWTPFGTWNRYSSGEKIKTDPGGVYRVAGLPAGEYLVRVSEGDTQSERDAQPEDGAYTNGFFMAAYYPDAVAIKDAQAVTVIEGSESTGVDIRMPERAAHRVSGTVKFGPDNEPGAFAEVLIERTDEVGYSDGGVTGATTARADDNGKWEVQGLPAGDYSIKVGGAVKVGPPNAGTHVTVAPKRIPIRVEYDDVVVPEIKLSRGSTIKGKVTWDGNPPKDNYFQVLAIPASRLSSGADSDVEPGADALFSGSLGLDGSFWILGLPAGKYSIRLWGPQANEKYYVKSVTRKGVDLKQSLLKVGEDTEIKDVVIALATDFATVEGQLTQPEASARLDLQTAVVILAPANDATRRLNRELLTIQPDAKGKFVAKCAPGEYFLTAVTPTEIKNLAKPISDDYFKDNKRKFERVKVKAGEQLKGVTLRAGSN